MSIELPEARMLATQLNKTIVGKVIEDNNLRDVDRMMRTGFVNKDLSEFKPILEKTVEITVLSGNTIRVKLSVGVIPG